ncbi:MAG: hypothetical protein ACI9D0_001465 [Bacteroidia bacterium]|jgi:hypothetical protein
MHSWVFRNRLRLEQLYGVPKRAVGAGIRPVEQVAAASPEVAPSPQGDQLAPWASIERTEGGIVILHPTICGVPRIKRLPSYRRGA